MNIPAKSVTCSIRENKGNHTHQIQQGVFSTPWSRGRIHRWSQCAVRDGLNAEAAPTSDRRRHLWRSYRRSETCWCLKPTAGNCLQNVKRLQIAYKMLQFSASAKWNRDAPLQRVEMRLHKISGKHLIKVNNSANQLLQRDFLSQVKRKRFRNSIYRRIAEQCAGIRSVLPGASHAKVLNIRLQVLRKNLAQIRSTVVIDRLHGLEESFHFVWNFVVACTKHETLSARGRTQEIPMPLEAGHSREGQSLLKETLNPGWLTRNKTTWHTKENEK